MQQRLAHPVLIVPTRRLRAAENVYRYLDAERPGLHSHAERGNDVSGMIA